MTTTYYAEVFFVPEWCVRECRQTYHGARRYEPVSKVEHIGLTYLLFFAKARGQISNFETHVWTTVMDARRRALLPTE